MKRLILFALLLACGLALIVSLHLAKVSSPLRSTLTSSFQLLGTPIKLVDRVASRMVPVGELDERALGDTFRERYDAQTVPGDLDVIDSDQAYLDALMTKIRPFAHRQFPYRAYVISGHGQPNAMALPGGVILVTRELLAVLRSEAELVAVLAHETGHIERGHCFDAVRFRLLARKFGSDTLGAFADASARLLLNHAYSKTVEGEADEYAYMLMTSSTYDPMGVGNSFASLQRYGSDRKHPTPAHAEPIRDYFMSHPPLEIREAKYSERASVWWQQHAKERRYVGRQNLIERRAQGLRELAEEWVSGAG